MSGRIAFEIALLVALVLANGAFALAEMAFVSAKRARLAAMAARGDRGAAAALRLLETPERFLSTTQVGITLIGLLATNVVTRAALDTFDAILARLPLVRLLYTAAKDLMNAFAGEKRRFNTAVRVRIDPDKDLWVLGFVTAQDVSKLGLPDHVGVYLPQSYNFAGQLLLVPATQVTPVDIEGTEQMKFIVSGGVAGAHDEA